MSMELTVAEAQCQRSLPWTLASEGTLDSWWRVWYKRMSRQRRGPGWGKGGSDLWQSGRGGQTEGASDCLQGSVPVKS